MHFIIGTPHSEIALSPAFTSADALRLLERSSTNWVVLKSQKLILSQIRRPEVQNQGAAGPCLLRSLSETILPAPASSFQFLALWLRHSNLCLPSSESPPLSFMRTLVTGFKTRPDNPESSHLRILNLITSMKSHFPNKVNFTGSAVRTQA